MFSNYNILETAAADSVTGANQPPSNKMNFNQPADFSLNAQTKSIFENVFVFFGILTGGGAVVNLEGKIFKKTNTDPLLLIGQKFSETVYWQSSEFVGNVLDNAVAAAAGGTNEKVLLDFRVRAEEIIKVELNLQKLNNGNIFFCAQEVTDREREVQFYKQQSEQLLYAAENAGVGLWFWDLANDKIFTTPKCNRIFGIEPSDIFVAATFFNVVHPDDLENLKKTFDESRTGGTEFHAEYRVIYPNGNVQWISARGRAFLDQDGEPKNMMGVVHTITDRKLANEELANIVALEKKARDEAEEANRAKDFFLAVVSHELRSPLNAILGWTKILLTRNLEAEKQRNALETIEKSARSQAKLIEDLVDSARVSSGKLRLELRPLNFYEVVKTVYDLQKPTAESREIDFNFTADENNIQVYGDGVRLQQIVGNLVSNALKFTSDGGAVNINVEAKGEIVEVTVEDTGKGIAPELLPTIFRQFKQGDEKSSAGQSGLGLGLSIVKVLTEKHNGKIEAASAGIGYGSIFTLTLPLCGAKISAAGNDVKEARKEALPLENLKILIVEDDPDSREVLQLYLEQSGANVRSAESVCEAMKLLRESAEAELPNVIVSDLAMPEEDGYSLMTRIRQLSAAEGGAIPALALSAFAANENKQKAYRVGFQKYHTKPFEPDGIIEDIRAIAKK